MPKGKVRDGMYNSLPVVITIGSTEMTLKQFTVEQLMIFQFLIVLREVLQLSSMLKLM